MRAYKIVITNPKTGQIVVPTSLAGLGILDATYTSFTPAGNLRGALNIEMEVYVYPFATPAGGSFVRIWGISLQEISQAHDLNGFLIEVWGGMQKGLPLANPEQFGLLFSGYIFQAFGNWVGTDMTLDLIVAAGTGTLEAPVNIIFNWNKGTPLKDAIEEVISIAFPDFKTDIQINPDLVYTEKAVGYYQTIEEYASYLKSLTKSIIGGDYSGVGIVLKQDTFFVYDGSISSLPKEIDFKDLIGQPTWIDSPIIQFKCPMRADIEVGNFIKMPQGLVTTNSAAQSSQIDLSTAFKGTFQVNQVFHFGNFRQPDAASWVTVIDAGALTGL